MDHAAASDEPATAVASEVARESITMGLYITISLLAVLSAQPQRGANTVGLTLVWGTTLGLTLAHWFAFQLTARLFAVARLTRRDRLTMVGQVGASSAVAALASVPLVLNADAGLALSRGILAGLIGLFAFGVVRRHGGGLGRATLNAVVVVVVASAVAIGKYVLTGH